MQVPYTQSSHFINISGPGCDMAPAKVRRSSGLFLCGSSPGLLIRLPFPAGENRFLCCEKHRPTRAVHPSDPGRTSGCPRSDGWSTQVGRYFLQQERKFSGCTKAFFRPGLRKYPDCPMGNLRTRCFFLTRASIKQMWSSGAGKKRHAAAGYAHTPNAVLVSYPDTSGFCSAAVNRLPDSRLFVRGCLSTFLFPLLFAERPTLLFA